MTTAEREIHIRLCFEVLYPGRAIDFVYPNDDQIHVYADNLHFVADLASDDDGFFYFVPVVKGHRVTDLTVRIRYPI
jgi:hypothetical protein